MIIPFHFSMPRNYKRKLGTRKYRDYSDERLSEAVNKVSSGVMSSYEAEKKFKIPRRSIENKVKNKHMRSIGAPTQLTDEEEKQLVDLLIVCAEFGYPLTEIDVRIVVQQYLIKNNRHTIFQNNLPGKDWFEQFKRRHSDKLTERVAQNIKRARAETTIETVEEYFQNLERTLADTQPSNILNFDETNFSDEPGSKRCLFRRSVKHPERIMNYSKGAISVMFAGTADGKLLAPYVVYKSLHLWDSWCQGGPKGTRFNRSKSGWFDACTFEDWFRTIVIPWARRLSGQKIIIGDNLSSHLSIDIIKECKKYDIVMTFLPPNTTHLTQPLDVCFFRPLKIHWRNVLTEYKTKHPHASGLCKDDFPKLLKKVIEKVEKNGSQNLVSGFESTGIYPLNANRVLQKIPSRNNTSEKVKENINDSVMDFLIKVRGPQDKQPTKRRKKVSVQPGHSVSQEDFVPNSSSTPTCSRALAKSSSSDSEESSEEGMYHFMINGHTF